MPFETFVSPDELHMNDWSYGCVAKRARQRDRRGGDPSDRDRVGPHADAALIAHAGDRRST